MSEPERTQAKRQQIRAGAQRLFLKLGYERTSMDAIAAEARVSKQTLYRYYQTKDALFIDILDAHQPLTVMHARVEVAGEGRHQRAGVQRAGGRWRESADVRRG